MSDCNCPWDYADTQELLRNTAPINMTIEELDQQEKFEFLKEAAIQIAAARQVIRPNLETHTLSTDPETMVAHAIGLLDAVWKQKGKLRK